PVLPDLSLNVQIPLVHVHRIEIIHLRRYVTAIERKLDVVVVYANALLTCECRHGISTLDGGPWIGEIEIRARIACRVSERRGRVHLSSGEHHRPVSVHSVRRADGHAGLDFGIPGQSEPWVEFCPPRAIKILSTGVLRIARENQSRWSVDKYFAVDALLKQFQIEVFVLAAIVVGRQIRLPSY